MKKQKDITLILIPGFILTVLWVVFNIYHNRVTSTISEPLTTQIREIPGQFDTLTLEEIKQRDRTEPIYELESAPETEVTPIPTPEEIQEASEGAEALDESN